MMSGAQWSNPEDSENTSELEKIIYELQTGRRAKMGFANGHNQKHVLGV